MKRDGQMYVTKILKINITRKQNILKNYEYLLKNNKTKKMKKT